MHFSVFFNGPEQIGKEVSGVVGIGSCFLGVGYASIAPLALRLPVLSLDRQVLCYSVMTLTVTSIGTIPLATHNVSGIWMLDEAVVQTALLWPLDFGA